MIKISAFLMDRPITKWCLVVVTICLFLFSILGIKRSAYPRVDLNEMHISSMVPGFSALEMEQEVTDKIEAELENISSIESYYSKTFENFSLIIVKIDPDSNLKESKDEIRNAVTSINDYPQEMESRPTIMEIKIDNKPMSILGVTSLTDHLGRAREHALKIKQILLEVDGISEIREKIQKKEIHILLNRDKLDEFEMTVEEVISQIKNNQRKLSAGTIKKNFQVKRLITYAKAKNLTEIENIVLRASGIEGQGVIIKLKDVAEVRVALKKNHKIIKFNGFKGYQLELVRQSEADIITTAKKVNQVLERYLKEATDPDLQLVLHEDDSQETEERLTITYQNAIFGLILVCLTLFFFLNRSIAFWSCWGIPSTLFLSFTLMWMTGVSINTVSLCAIIIMMGVVVDNPTIIGESNYYYRQMNFSRKDSSLNTLRRILRPLIFAGLTTMVSFASMFFIPGTLGDFAIEIPMVVIFMLLASFFESIFILPAHLAHAKMSPDPPWREKFMGRFRSFYQVTLNYSLGKVGLTISLMVVILGAGMFFSVYFSKGFELFPKEQAFKINFNATVDINSSLEFTDLQARKIEKIIRSFPEKNIISSYLTKVGGTADHEFEIQLRLISYFERETSAEEVKDFILTQIREDESISLTSFDYHIDGGGVPSGKPVEINVFAHDFKDRKQVIEKIAQEMEELGYFSQVISSLKEGKLERRVVPKATIYYSGISLKQIAEVLRVAYEGIKAGNFEFEGQMVDWLLKFDDQSKNFDHPLSKITVLNPRNGKVLIEDLVAIEESETLSEIEHEGGKRKNVLSAHFDKTKISSAEVYQLLTEKYGNIHQTYPGVRVEFTGEAKKSFDVFQDFILAIIASVIVIYFLLVFQFNNLVQPFMVITSIPFGVVGIMVAFTLHGYSLSFLAMIGILGFGGVVINASLIMVDYINEIKSGRVEEEKLNPSNFFNRSDYLKAVVIRGSSLRFRPIVITTFTTTIGLIPTAYGILGKTDAVIAPMTFAMLWGLLSGTLVGLYLVPLFYYLWARVAD